MDNSIARSAASYYKSQRFSLILNDRFNFLFFFVLCWPGFLFKVWNTWLNLTYSRPWTVWAVLRTRINSNKICSKLNIILVKINTILCDFNDLSLFRKSDIFPASWSEEEKTVLRRWHGGDGTGQVRIFRPSQEENRPLQDERSLLQST